MVLAAVRVAETLFPANPEALLGDAVKSLARKPETTPRLALQGHQRFLQRVGGVADHSLRSGRARERAQRVAEDKGLSLASRTFASSRADFEAILSGKGGFQADDSTRRPRTMLSE